MMLHTLAMLPQEGIGLTDVLKTVGVVVAVILLLLFLFVFLKYAKLYEHYQRDRHGNALLPEGAPPLEPPKTVEPAPDAHRQLGRVPVLDGKTWNTPALAGNLLLVRNDREAVCLELPLE